MSEVLKRYGMHRPYDLAKAVGIGRRYAWMLWHGHRRMSARLALKLYETKGVPIHELLQAQPEDESTKDKAPRGRPPKAEEESDA